MSRGVLLFEVSTDCDFLVLKNNSNKKHKNETKMSSNNYLFNKESAEKWWNQVAVCVSIICLIVSISEHPHLTKLI